MTRVAVDLFSGSGGVTAGLKLAGWSVVAAVDNDPVASRTYRANHPDVSLIDSDITALATRRSLKAFCSGKKIDLLVVCAPCQPFSSQNRKKGYDPRDQLILSAVPIARALRPSLIFFENVPGLATPRHQPVLDLLRKRLRGLGYHLSDPHVKDAADYGVPQRRRRCIMVASTKLSALRRFEATDLAAPRRSVLQAIGDLVDTGEADDHLHRGRVHSLKAIERLRAIPPDGGSRHSLPEHLRLACHKDDKSFPDVYGRMSWNDVAPTLTTGCTDVTKGRFAHPVLNRAITLREAARLQTFPDSYRFEGNHGQISKQIGNAVPPAMVACLVRGFDAALDQA